MNNERTTEELFWEIEERGGYGGALARAAWLCSLKARDYQPDKSKQILDNLDVDIYFPFGIQSYVQMINMKSQRMVSLASHTNKTQFEPLLDSALDIINYAAFLVNYISKQK